jgi:hypothetical protein
MANCRGDKAWIAKWLNPTSERLGLNSSSLDYVIIKQESYGQANDNRGQKS